MTSRLVTIIFLLTSTVAFAQKSKTTSSTTPGIDAVKAANDSISALLKSKAPAAKVTKAVKGFIDVDSLGKAAMDSNWSTLKKKQQKQFLGVLHQLIEANYVKGMKAQVNYTTKYDSDTLNANGTRTVVTHITFQHKGKQQTDEVDYTLQQTGKKKVWMAYDINTAGSDLVDNYKSTFQNLMDKGGFDNLMSHMQDKLDEMNKDNAAATDDSTASAAGATN
jgi:phospholipid transport system substrate-binding protein